MHTDILAPQDLFQKDVRYIIPPFQRPYVWSQDDQWEPLWEDVRNVAENYLEELERSGNDGVEAEQETKPHFLGAVVLQQVPTSTKDIEQREVVDGQQRMTTLQLLLDAIQQVCEKSERSCFNGAAKRLSKLVLNDKDLVEDDKDHHVFKLWPTISDRQAFRHAMDNGLAVDDFEESQIVQAHEFFQLQVKNWLGDDVEPLGRRIDALEAAVKTKLQMVVIGLDIGDDPNLIFETLNARGTPLEESDLIKNFVLSQERDEKVEIWADLDKQWWRERVRQGRLFRPRLDMLFNYWLAMRKGSEISPTRVFNEFRRYVDGEGEVRAVMSDIKRDFANYHDFETQQGRSAEEKSFYYHLDVMQARVITPALLLLLSIEAGTRKRAFDALESFLVRRMICRWTTKGYNILVLELANRLQQDGLDRADRVTADFLREQKAYARTWPSDADVASALESLPLYRLLTRGRLRLVLEGVEFRLRSSGKSEQCDVPKYLTIEHLMPVSWKGQWLLPEGADEYEAAEERSRLIHTIGNLTLVTQKLNSAMSNDPWKHKRDQLRNHGVLLLNNELLDEPCWSDDTIHCRSLRVANLVSERWPGPDSSAWDEGP